MPVPSPKPQAAPEDVDQFIEEQVPSPSCRSALRGQTHVHCDTVADCQCYCIP